MKCFLFLFNFIAIYGIASALDKPVQEIKKNDNYTIQRLMLYNKSGKILMEKNAFGWMTPAIRSNENQSLKEGLSGLAKKIGVEITPVRLRGIFTYKFEGLSDHMGLVSYRTHYEAKVKSGEIIRPESKTIRYEWLTVNQAKDSISHPGLKAEFAQMTKQPDKIWGGSFLCIFQNDKLESVRQIEAFYTLNK